MVRTPEPDAEREQEVGKGPLVAGLDRQDMVGGGHRRVEVPLEDRVEPERQPSLGHHRAVIRPRDRILAQGVWAFGLVAHRLDRVDRDRREHRPENIRATDHPRHQVQADQLGVRASLRRARVVPVGNQDQRVVPGSRQDRVDLGVDQSLLEHESSPGIAWPRRASTVPEVALERVHRLDCRGMRVGVRQRLGRGVAGISHLMEGLGDRHEVDLAEPGGPPV